MSKALKLFSVASLSILALTGSIASAAVKDTIKFELSPKVISQKVHTAPGETHYLVASNSGFSIIAEGMIGELQIDFVSDGHTNGRSYGSHSQTPPSGKSCAFLTHPNPTKIYSTPQRTALSAGSPIQQAIKVIVTHDADYNSKIEFVAEHPAQGIQSSNSC